MVMTIDRTTRLLEPVREGLLTALTPVTVLGESPYLLGRRAVDTLASRDSLEARVRVLEEQNLSLSHLAQQYRVLREENDRLLALAGSRARLPVDVLAAEIIGVVPAVNSHRVIVDKGRLDGVQSGQAVIDASGLFGQVVEVGRYTSGVLLVADRDHAVPVEVNRNGVRSIAGGTGRLDRLELEFVPVTTDIRPGDLVVTSGLGGRFPRGYPVGEVVAVAVDPNSSFATVSVKPSAQLDRSRHVLVVVGDVPEAPVSVEADESPAPDPTPAPQGAAQPASDGAAPGSASAPEAAAEPVVPSTETSPLPPATEPAAPAVRSDEAPGAGQPAPGAVGQEPATAAAGESDT